MRRIKPDLTPGEFVPSRSDDVMVVVGFNPRSNEARRVIIRRVATTEQPQSSLRDEEITGRFIVRGLKPTATIVASLRDERQRSRCR